MTVFRVTAWLVDGGLREWNEGPELLPRLRQLQAEGLEGERLIHALLTDDWGPPPRYVDIEGTQSDGSAFRIRIPYQLEEK